MLLSLGAPLYLLLSYHDLEELLQRLCCALLIFLSNENQKTLFLSQLT